MAERRRVFAESAPNTRPHPNQSVIAQQISKPAFDSSRRCNIAILSISKSRTTRQISPGMCVSYVVQRGYAIQKGLFLAAKSRSQKRGLNSGNSRLGNKKDIVFVAGGFCACVGIHSPNGINIIPINDPLLDIFHTAVAIQHVLSASAMIGAAHFF